MAEKLKSGFITEKEILEAEVLVRVECPYRKLCRNALDDLLIKRDRIRRAESDPTTQEEDHRRQK